MGSACDAEKALDEKIDLLEASAGALGFAAIISAYNPTFALIFGAAGFIQYARAQSLSDDKEVLDDLCDLERARKAQQDSDGGAGGVGGTGEVYAGAGRTCHAISYGGYVTTDPDGTPVVTASVTKWICAPLALDLDRDGIEYRTQDVPIHADFDGDGRYSDYSWVSPDDGLIVYDDNMDGIGQKDEWVLTTFVHGAETDLDALRAFDSNGNGILNANDALWAKLKVGRDLNQNGRFDAGELATFAAHGITRVNLEQNVTAVSTPDAPSETAPGVFTFNTGIFFKDGAHQFAPALPAGDRTGRRTAAPCIGGGWSRTSPALSRAMRPPRQQWGARVSCLEGVA